MLEMMETVDPVTSDINSEEMQTLIGLLCSL